MRRGASQASRAVGWRGEGQPGDDSVGRSHSRLTSLVVLVVVVRRQRVVRVLSLAEVSARSGRRVRSVGHCMSVSACPSRDMSKISPPERPPFSPCRCVLEELSAPPVSPVSLVRLTRGHSLPRRDESLCARSFERWSLWDESGLCEVSVGGRCEPVPVVGLRESAAGAGREDAASASR